MIRFLILAILGVSCVCGPATLCLGNSHKNQSLKLVSLSTDSDEILYSLFATDRYLAEKIRFSSLCADQRYSATALRHPNFDKKLCLPATLEALLAFQPDKIILSPFNNPSLVASIKRAGFETILPRKVSEFSDIEKNINLIGQAINRTRESEEMANQFKSNISKLKGIASKDFPTETCVLFHARDFIFPSSDTTIEMVFELLGLRNCTKLIGQTGWQLRSLESLLEQNVSLIIGAKDPQLSSKELIDKIRRSPRWSDLKNIKTLPIFLYPSPLVFSSSLAIVDFAQLLAGDLAKLKKP